MAQRAQYTTQDLQAAERFMRRLAKPRPPKPTKPSGQPAPPMPKTAIMRPPERRPKQHTVPRRPGKPSARAVRGPPAPSGARPPFDKLKYTRRMKQK